MHAVISLLQSRKFWWYLLLTSMLLHDVIITSYRWQQYAECLVTTLFQQDSASAHCAAYLLLHQKTPNFLAPNLWPPTAQISVLWLTRSSLSLQHRVYCRQIPSVDELKWRLMNVLGGLEQSIFYWDYWPGGMEDIERVSMLNEDIWSTNEDIWNTACELTMLILSISVTFHVTCLTVASLITKSCQPRLSILFIISDLRYSDTFYGTRCQI